MTYRVKIEQFEGPLDLLLSLIEEQKLDIVKLSLATVTDQYLEHIKNNQEIHLENLSDFLSVAAKLILIKSKALLPLLKLTAEEEEEIEDLTEKLKEYKKFKEVSLKIGRMDKLRKISISREGYWGIKSFFYPPADLGVFDLKKHFQLILAEIPLVEKLEEELVKEVITLEEKISDLQRFLTEKIETSFSEIVSNVSEKVEVIISFLAMLEMVKQRMIWVEQGNLFSEIKLKNR
jgi:segregation and condensation protein A